MEPVFWYSDGFGDEFHCSHWIFTNHVLGNEVHIFIGMRVCILVQGSHFLSLELFLEWGQNSQLQNDVHVRGFNVYPFCVEMDV